MTSNDAPLRSGFGPLIARTARQWRRCVDRRLQPFGLTQATWLPLLQLARAPAPMPQKDLARSLALDDSSIVRLLDTLQREGLVDRREGQDRRVKVLHLTPSGKTTVASVEAVSQAVRKRVLAGLSDEDIGAAQRVLERILDELAKLEREDEDE